MITPAYSMTATERVLPRLALDFTTGVLDPRVTVARALNTATAINSSGFIAVVNANLPRFDYDPVTLQPRGLLIEEARTNVCFSSGNLGNLTYWSGDTSGGSVPTVTANYAVAPDGTTSAARLQVNRGAGTFSRWRSASSPTTLGQYTASVWLRTTSGTGTANVGLRTNATGINVVVTGQWQRFSVTDASTTNVPDLQIMSFTSIPGNDVSFDVLAWGGQTELGSFATSYIPTAASSVTRNADVVSMTGTNFSSWYNASEGTFVANFIPYAAGSYTVFSATNNSFNNRIQGEASNAVQFLVGDGGAIQAFLDAGTITAGALSKIATSYKAGRFAVSLNSSALAQILSGTVPSVNRLDIGNLSGFAQFYNGWIPGLRYFPLSLTAAELQAFSK